MRQRTSLDRRTGRSPASKRPWSLRDRLDERTRAEMIAANRGGETAASLACGHGLSVRSVKHLVAAGGVRRKQLPAWRIGRGQDARPEP